MFIKAKHLLHTRQVHTGRGNSNLQESERHAENQVGLAATKQALQILNSTIYPQNHCRESKDCVLANFFLLVELHIWRVYHESTTVALK